MLPDFSPASPRLAMPLIRSRFSAMAFALVLASLLLSGCVTPVVTEPDDKTPPEVKVVTETVYVPVYIESATPPQAPGATPAPHVPESTPLAIGDEREQTLSLLGEIGRSLSAAPDELKRDHAAAQAAFNRERSLINRLRLAWLAALLGPAAGDDARLQALLEPLMSKAGGLPAAHPLRPIAETLQLQLAERSRQVREEQKKAEALQQKLDALKALEKQLLERERRRP